LAVELDHPAYDCVYLALALAKDCKLATADEHLRRKLGRTGSMHFRDWRFRWPRQWP
jgi:predicted nucleic acid-binding protein